MTTETSAICPSWLQFKIPCSQLQDWEEDIYDDLCYVTFSSNTPEVGVNDTCVLFLRITINIVCVLC